MSIKQQLPLKPTIRVFKNVTKCEGQHSIVLFWGKVGHGMSNKPMINAMEMLKNGRKF